MLLVKIYINLQIYFHAEIFYARDNGLTMYSDFLYICLMLDNYLILG